MEEKIRKNRVLWSTYKESCYHTFDNSVVRHITHYSQQCDYQRSRLKHFKITRESTQMRNHTAAQSVIRDSPHQVLCWPMIGSIWMRNRSAAQSLSRNSINQVTCIDMTGSTTFNCSQCSYKGTQKAHLISHERTHTDEKPFSFLVCSKKFSLFHSLRTHERIHTDDEPFSCSKWDKKFTQAGHLKTHKRFHTDENHSAAQRVARNSHRPVI